MTGTNWDLLRALFQEPALPFPEFGGTTNEKKTSNGLRNTFVEAAPAPEASLPCESSGDCWAHLRAESHKSFLPFATPPTGFPRPPSNAFHLTLPARFRQHIR